MFIKLFKLIKIFKLKQKNIKVKSKYINTYYNSIIINI